MAVRRALGWSYFGQAIGIMMQFGTSIVLARILTPYDFGVFSIAAGISAIIAIFVSSNVSAYIIREANLQSEILRSAGTANFLFCLILTSALLAASIVTHLLMAERQIPVILGLLSAATMIGAIEFLPTAMCQREMRFDVIVRVSLLRSAIISISTIVGALLGWKAISFAAGSIAGCITSACIYSILMTILGFL